MPSPLGKVSPKVTEEVRTFAKRKCIAEGDLYGNTKGIRPHPTKLRLATFPRGEGMTTPQIIIYRVVGCRALVMSVDL
jgi:hypothetical protein